MTGSRLAMFGFAGRSQSDTLLGRLVSFRLVGWHGFYSDEGQKSKIKSLATVDGASKGEKGRNNRKLAKRVSDAGKGTEGT